MTIHMSKCDKIFRKITFLKHKFYSSPRYKHQQTNDAMAYVRKLRLYGQYHRHAAHLTYRGIGMIHAKFG